jgi:hypothetical protein
LCPSGICATTGIPKLDPFAPEFAEHFARYCRAAAEYVVARTPGPISFTPDK